MSNEASSNPNLPAILEALKPTQTAYGSSRWKTLAECEAKHDLHYVQLIKPVGGSTTLAQELGIMVHACLGYIAAGIIAAEPEPRHWGDVFDVAAGMVDESDRAIYDPFSIAETERLLSAYDAHWGVPNLGLSSQIKIIGAEEALEAELAPGLPYSCRHDLLVEAFGELVAVDHKTRSRARSSAGDLERELRTDPSIVGQSWLTQVKYGLKSPPAVWLSDLIKTKIPAFERHLVRVEQGDVDAWKEAMIQRLGLEHERVEMGIPAMRNHYACVSFFGGSCQYLKYCFGSEEERSRYFEKVEPPLAPKASSD